MFMVRSNRRRPALAAVTAASLVAASVVAVLVSPGSGGAATAPSKDSFYSYSGSTALKDIKPGTVLKTRTLAYHFVGIPLPLSVTQLLFRTTNAIGQPVVSVTSVVRPPGADPAKVISYQSFYDSLNPDDSPSYAIAGGVTPGAFIPNAELPIFGSFLAGGFNIVVPDTEGETADFSAGPEYGMNTLDSIRAALNSPDAHLVSTAKVGMIGYSGGAIATGWAASLAPTYAPDVNKHLVGAAEGGILVDPDHNLHYINGSVVWAGVAVMSIIGLARAYHVDLTPYMSDYGKQLYAKLHSASIATVLGAYPGLTWAKLAKPAYATPESVPAFVKIANTINLGSYGAPTIPMFMGQGANGVLEGTPGLGKGDGVMVAADVRSLARQWCAHGTTVKYVQYDLTSHVTTVPFWLPAAIEWLGARFGSSPAPQNCASIKPGNSLAPIPAA